MKLWQHCGTRTLSAARLFSSIYRLVQIEKLSVFIDCLLVALVVIVLATEVPHIWGCNLSAVINVSWPG